MIWNARAKSSRTLADPPFAALSGSCLERPTSSAASCAEVRPRRFPDLDACVTSAKSGTEIARGSVRALIGANVSALSVIRNTQVVEG
jgi:hypothetical protein